jgi:hypothetical protein
MDSFGAVFARVPDGGVLALEAAIQSVRKAPVRGPLGVLAHEADEHDFAVVDRWGPSDDEPSWYARLDEPNELAALSALVGEVVAEYSIETDLCHFAHWRDGELVRLLVWSDGAWETARGEPQAWEQALFTAPWREASLEVASEAGVDADAVDAAFAAGRVVAGSRWPTLITPDLGMSATLRDNLRLPPFGFQPWPRRRDVVAKLPR